MYHITVDGPEGDQLRKLSLEIQAEEQRANQARESILTKALELFPVGSGIYYSSGDRTHLGIVRGVKLSDLLTLMWLVDREDGQEDTVHIWHNPRKVKQPF